MRARATALACGAAVALLGLACAGCGNGDQGADSAPTVPSRTSTTAAPIGDAAALAACAHRGEFGDDALRAAFETTVGTFRRWHFEPAPSHPGEPVAVRPDQPMPIPQFLQGRADSETIFVCYVDGNVGGSLRPPAPPPPVSGSGPTSSVPPRNRALLLMDRMGNVYGYVYGYQSGLPLMRPTANGA